MVRRFVGRRIVIYERVGIFLSTVAILLGLGMIGTTLARIGPSFSVGVVFGTLLMLYGAVRLYFTLKG
jgi:hypothetical protein